jgi:RNA polymerase sigma-70 factor (ECF subfamily)
LNIVRNTPGNEANSAWERHLVERATSGDREAFLCLIDIYRPFLMKSANSQLRNRDDANDAVQETIYKVLRSIEDFDPNRPLKPWLSRICANCCIDKARQRKRDASQLEMEDNIPEPSPQLDDQVGSKIRQNQLMEAVGRLPQKYRTIILMRHFNNMEVSEIATELSKPEGTIKSWLFRARALLKKDLRLAFQ